MLFEDWVKYHKKRVTLIIGERVQNWDQLPNGTLVMESEQLRLLDKYTTPEPDKPKVISKGMEFLSEAPYRDYVHFVGSLKPWLVKGPIVQDISEPNQAPRLLWFRIFSHLNDELRLGLDLTQWEKEQRKLEQPPLGLSDSANVNEGRFTTLKISDDDITAFD